ncbi:MAG: S-methyl-5-thioribose-1-phosphate isomerase [Beijerinckiaceae bacterium]|nr:S-methyl-5-thioribose-1-phosphate isomerase [Beijerinckiaceae bacterium]
MNIHGQHYRNVWLHADGRSIEVIDQTKLPHQFEIARLDTLDAVAHAIRTMVVRGAPLIGVVAAYGLAIGLEADPSNEALRRAAAALRATRPTAVNLHWTMDLCERTLMAVPPGERYAAAMALAQRLADEDVALNARIGENGLAIIAGLAERRPSARPLTIATHCNAGWLGTVDWGTALAPIYRAHDAGIAVHVMVDETRPRLQGAALTAFELGQHGVPHTIIADGACGHMMRQGKVDLCIVGCDRVAANGDTANKIGTYMQALAAADNGLPFYVALPSRTVDLSLASGDLIEIEERGEDEVLEVTGRLPSGERGSVLVAAPGSRAFNPAFDVTPARLITGYITEIGVLRADELHRLGDVKAAA